MFSPKLRRFAVYTCVNIAASAVDFTSFLVLTHLFGAPTLQSIAAYSSSILVNYKLQRRFVFVGNISGKSEYRVFMEFVGTGMFGLASTALVIWFTIGIMGLSTVVAKTLAMVVCFFVLYVARNHFVFNEGASSAVAAQAGVPVKWSLIPSVISGCSACLSGDRIALDDLGTNAVGSFVLCFSALVTSAAF
jgi:putative flippase GtrA